MLLHDLPLDAARQQPTATAVCCADLCLDYATLSDRIRQFAAGLRALGIQPGDRVLVYLPKCFEAVISIFGTTLAGAVIVPLSPQLKAEQVVHIGNDSGARLLLTSGQRLQQLAAQLGSAPRLKHAIVTGTAAAAGSVMVTSWDAVIANAALPDAPAAVDENSLAALLYTSGSTGLPKGVMLSHRNLVCGAESVASYLQNSSHDRLLAILPLSFDYGLSQLTTAFLVGASVTLLEYLLPIEIPKAVARHRITGIAGVPTVWIQLARLQWPDAARDSLRYLTNSGGRFPPATIDALRTKLPATAIIPMYGLTEAFRSTYLAADEVQHRPMSIGKAIPNATVLVVDEQGRECPPGQPGELVHLGPLVAQGYWQDAARTRQRFRPAPVGHSGTAVWSGDRVYRDADGYLYFVERMDEMIKTSGYRVSPSEVEDVLYQLPAVTLAAALGVAHAELGQAIIVCYTADADLETTLKAHCARHLPPYMQPHRYLRLKAMPLNANRKCDRARLKQDYARLFDTADDS